MSRVQGLIVIMSALACYVAVESYLDHRQEKRRPKKKNKQTHALIITTKPNQLPLHAFNFESKTVEAVYLMRTFYENEPLANEFTFYPTETGFDLVPNAYTKEAGVARLKTALAPDFTVGVGCSVADIAFVLGCNQSLFVNEVKTDARDYLKRMLEYK